jgi:hypothetical protein
VTLEKDTRDAIGRTVRALRELFEEEFGKQASGRFGIRSSRRTDVADAGGLAAWLDPLESLSLTPAEFAQRDELVHALNYLESEGNEPDEAVARLIREAAFTAVNRMLAVRVAEAIGILPAVLSVGRQSPSFKEAVGDLFPALANDENAYWTYLQVSGDELAPGVPRLFDRRRPTSAFVPSRACVDEALTLMTAGDLADAWVEPETLGWGYQFFNGDDVKQMRDASAAPRNSRELAVRNQFFTPRYVVDWLVQNTLGRRLVQAGYDLHLPLLVGEIGDEQPLELEDVRVLDPAVGSGHFLLGSYDLLERAWASTGIPLEGAAVKILPCLFGVDIDPRATQVAQAVLLLRARRSAPDANLAPPRIVTAVALPHNKDLREEVFGGLTPATQVAARDVTEALDLAPQLGPLLKVEQRLEAERAAFKTAPRLTDGDAGTVLDDFAAALDRLVPTEASPEQRMFTAEATDALRFIDICQQRYDVVLMNPPFGEGVDGLPRRHLKALYPDWWTELYACFLTRARELSKDHSAIGMVSSSSYFTTRKMREFRKDLVEQGPPIAILDLGFGVMSDAAVEATAGVFRTRPCAPVVEYADLKDLPPAAREAAVRSLAEDDYQKIDLRPFLTLDRSPFAFHAPDALLELWSSTSERLEPSLAVVRTGQKTFDDFRFLRLRWECLEGDAGWIAYQKGGDYHPYVEPSHLVIDWRDDGRAMKDHAQNRHGTTAQVMQSSEYWFRPGLTAPRMGSQFGTRILGPDEIFGDRATTIIPHELDDRLALLGILNATAFAEAVRVFGRSRATENGALKSMPVGPTLLERVRAAGIEDHVEVITHLFDFWNSTDETSPHFSDPTGRGSITSGKQARSLLAADRERVQQEGEAVDLMVAEAFGFDPTIVYDDGVARRPDLLSKSLGQHFELATDWAARTLMWGVGLVFGRWAAPGVLRADDVSMALTTSETLADSVTAALDKVGVDAELLAGELRQEGVLGWVDRSLFAYAYSTYSASRRYAPIYWQLAVPSKRWGLWMYAPSLSRESLFAVAQAAREKLSSLNEQVRLARERAETDRDAQERAEGLEHLASEVEKFAAVADKVAQSGWEPDLNDGFVLNAAPLEELFVNKNWRGQIAKHRKAMQKGDYPWATVQREYFEKRR